MNKVIDRIKSQKEIIGAAVLLILGTVAVITWMNINFVTEASAASIDKEMSAQIKKVSVKLDTFMGRYDLDLVKTQIKDNQSGTFTLKQFIRVNGTDAQSETRLQQLEVELGELELKKTCIINNNPLCD